MTTTERDPIATLISELNGSCKPHMIAGINGNMPPGWQVSSVQALPTFADPAIALFAGADKLTDNGCGWHFVGAKLLIDAPHDHLKLADELARQLCAAIRKRGPPRVRVALDPGAIMPTRGTDGSAAYDLYSPTDVLIRRGQTLVIHSGVRIELPDHTWEVQVRARSSWSKRGILMNLSTVDADYRGVVGATVTNMSSNDESVKRGDRFAQMVIARVEHPEIEQVEVAELTPTARGGGGFGSTGK